MASLCGQKRCAKFSSMMTTCGVSRVSLIGEEAARDQRNLHGAEIVRACGAQIDLQLLAWRRRVSLDVDSSPTHGSGERQRRNRAFGDDAGQVGDAGFDFTVETGEALSRRGTSGSLATICMVSTWSAVNPGGTLCRRTKLRISSPAPMSRMSENGEFGNDEQATQSVAFQIKTAIGLSAAAAGLQGGVRIELDGAPCRREAEEHARGEREAEGEGQNRAVDSDVFEPGNIAGIHGAHDDEAEARYKESGGSAEEAEENALRQ